MQVKIFTIAILQDVDSTEELNRFLRSVKVLDIRKEFANTESGSYWSFCVTYLPIGNIDNQSIIQRKEKIDYKDVLSETDFKKFCLMRKIRKSIAEEDAIPPFAVFTDAELIEVVKLQNVDVKSLLSVKGIGQRKAEKYGDRFCNSLNQLLENEKAREPEEQNS